MFDSRQEMQKGEQNGVLRLNSDEAGRSGRRNLIFTDWDGDAHLNLFVNSRPNINFLQNVARTKGEFIFRDMGPVDARRLAGHSTSPTVVDWDQNGVPDLLVGAGDGHFYYLENTYLK